MPKIASSALVFFLALISTLVTSQSIFNGVSLSSTDAAYLSSETNVPYSQKRAWCDSHNALCSTLCNKQTVSSNYCTSLDLSWSCLCSSNNSAPALAYYKFSVPAQECAALLARCIDGGGNQDDCRGKYVCGTGSNDDASTAAQADQASATSLTRATGMGTTRSTGSRMTGSATATSGAGSSSQTSPRALADSVSSSPPGSGGSTGGLDTGSKVGIGVGIGVGLPLLVGVIVAVVYIRRLLNMAHGREQGIRAGELGPEDAVDEPKYSNSGSASQTQALPRFAAGSVTVVEPSAMSAPPAMQGQGRASALSGPGSTLVQPTMMSAPRGPV